MNPVSERHHQVRTADGLTLHALLAEPSSPPAAVLILCHGITTNCDEHGAFPALRDRALRAGLAVARFDFRAHGLSGGGNEELRLAGMRADAEAVLALIDQQLGTELPVIPLGVSFGGAAAVHLAASVSRCAGLALWYAIIDYAWNFAPDSPVPFTQQMRAARSDADPPWSEMPLADGYHLPAGLVAEMARDVTASSLRELRIPVLAYHGSRDKLVDVEPLRRGAVGQPNIELRIALGAGHGFLLWRPWVIRQTVSWASRIVRDAEPD